MKGVLEDLVNRGDILGSQLYDIGSRMTTALQDCPAAAVNECNDLGSKASNLKQVANFSKVSLFFMRFWKGMIDDRLGELKLEVMPLLDL